VLTDLFQRLGPAQEKENGGVRMTDEITDHAMEVELQLRFPATGRVELQAD
jgi:hypothetical protein